MAELKNEGLPYRLYTEHPEIVPSGWDGRPATTATVDYLAPAYLDECDRWYGAIMPVLATRLATSGGPVTAVQLDNEVGMLAWVSNSPDLTPQSLSEFRSWVDEHRPDAADLYPRGRPGGGHVDGGRAHASGAVGRRRCGSTSPGSCAGGSHATSSTCGHAPRSSG